VRSHGEDVWAKTTHLRSAQPTAERTIAARNLAVACVTGDLGRLPTA
jgi:hypothetical protein